MGRRPLPTLADYAVIAVSPALIMCLVGSLVFFLIEVFYSGAYDTRLSFIMAMFVGAAVLIARISIEQGRGYAMMFAIPLAIVTAIATFRFVEFSGPMRSFSPIINIGLIALIWWCADKLTWDSTVIDESQDSSGAGLLKTAGLNQLEGTETLEDKEKLEGTSQRASPQTAAQARPASLSAWLQRFSSDRKRPHAPGVWVIYFSLAALPIFGFGNWFVPSTDLEARRYVFKLMVVYVGSALALLVTTSFLGLRRYLRQRRLEMPLEMSGVWFGTGAAMIVALLLICMLLPRRNAEYSVTQLPAFAGSPADLWTTEYAVGNEGQEDPEKADRTGEESQNPSEGGGQSNSQVGGKSEQQSSNQQSESGSTSQQGSQSNQGSSSDSKNNDSSQQQNSPSSQGNSGDSSSKPQNNSEPSSGQQSENSPSNQSQDQQGQSQGKDGQQGNQPPSSDNKSPREKSETSPSDNQQGKSPDETQNSENEQQKNQQSSQNSPSTNSQQQNNNNSSSGENSESQDQQDRRSQDNQSGSGKSESRKSDQANSQPQTNTRFDPSKIPAALGGTIGQLLKLLYWLIVIVIVGYVVWRYHRQICEAIGNFLESLRNLWANLFGGRTEALPPENVQPVMAGAPPKPFASFSDPFLTGMAESKPASEVIRYSFEALEAWARDHGFPRNPDQTPHEFAVFIGRQQSTMARDVATLAELYARCAYSRDAAPRSSVEHLRRLWLRLRESTQTSA